MSKWRKIKAAWEAETASNRALAKQFGVSEAAIRKRASSEKWVRRRCAVLTQKVRTAHPMRTDTKTAENPADLIPDLKGLTRRMIAELGDVSAHESEIANAITQETKNDKNEARRNAMLKAISLSARVQSLKALTQTAIMLKTDGVEMGKKAQKKRGAAQIAATGLFAPLQPPNLKTMN
ncbi:hypothetical protein CGLAMM_07315 [Acetobacteraceae bacterium EV16G]